MMRFRTIHGWWYLLVVSMVICSPGWAAGGEGSDETKNGPQEGVEERLKGETRDLNAPDKLSSPPEETGQPQVLIYYAVETAPDSSQSQNLQTLYGWMRDSTHPDVVHFANILEYDQKMFPRVVDEEIAAIKKQSGSTAENAVGAVLFTNRMAREGRFEYRLPSEESFSRGRWDLPKLERAVHRSYPLTHPAALQQALTVVAAKFDPKQHEFVLVLKSHGSRDRLLTPSVYVQPKKHSREEYLSEITESLNENLKEFVQKASPLVGEGGKAVVDEEGNRIFSDGHRLAWENRGFLMLTADKAEQNLYLEDQAGNSFATSEGKRVVLDAEEGVLKTSSSRLYTKESEPLRVAALWPMPVPEGATAFAPVLGSKMSTPILADTKSFTPILGQAKTSVPTLADGKSFTPILGQAKTSMPILGGGKSFTPILGQAKTSMPILDAGISTRKQKKRLGISKHEFLEILNGAGRLGMFFRTGFLESCTSELSTGQLSRLQEAQAPVETLWTSDPSGLRHRTINYDEVFSRIGEKTSLAKALNDELQDIYQQSQERSVE